MQVKVFRQNPELKKKKKKSMYQIALHRRLKVIQ